MATMIADTACIDPRADIADDVEIGPYCVVGPDVKIGRGTRLIAQVCLFGHTTLGENNVVHPFAVIGGEPQDYSYKGQPTRVEIGDHNVFREAVTIHRASEKEEGLTRIGSNNYLMANVHVGHDCVLGDRILVANNSMFAGHIHIESFANISGAVGCHVEGNPSKVRCINVVGLKRHNLSPEAISSLHEAHRLIFRARMAIQHATEILEAHGHLCAEVRRLLDFIEVQQQGKHGRGRERGRV
jgi:UDP-N-acetylglucosamine acyltransferase